MSGAPITDWEDILRRFESIPDPRIPPLDERNQDLKLIAEIVLRYAEVPKIDTAWAKHLRRRGENDKAARENIAERVRRRWGSDEVAQFFDDCRLLARIAWLHQPRMLAEAKAEIYSVRLKFERSRARAKDQYALWEFKRVIAAAGSKLAKSREGSDNRFAREAFQRAIDAVDTYRAQFSEHLSESGSGRSSQRFDVREAYQCVVDALSSYRDPIDAHLSGIGYGRSSKKWEAREMARCAADVFERWVGEAEIHARRNAGTPGEAKPADGLPSFVQDLMRALKISAHWERPLKQAIADRDEKAGAAATR